ncbi:MAG TPA: sugar ABC transporter ATP-binding protein [Vicinamibacterales bacterium]|nr:sugar ABC transporter ATP-binding protein [Vicinamibacterales bacterium]
MTAQAPALEMRGIRKSFPGVVALDGVDLTLRAGEVHMLLGENGAGKSTLMKILSGACRRDAGDVLIGGAPVDIDGPRDALARGIRVIYQELTLVPQLSVAENIFLGALPARAFGIVDRRALHVRTARLLEDLGMAIDPRTRVGRLGLAQRQMVEIAKALAADEATPTASVLVMDEPTSALTSREVEQLFGLIQRLASRGVAIVYITHRMDEVFRIGQRVTVLRDGRVVATRALNEVTVAELVRLMANRDLTDHFPKVRVERGPELLRVERLSRQGALRDVSFTLHAGEVLGVAGLLGAGRTELARAVAGADRYDAGEVQVSGAVARFRSPADAIACGIGLLPEDRKAEGLVAGLTVARNIALPHGRRLAKWGVLSSRSEADLAGPIGADLRIKATPAQPVRLLSGGNQQKVVLGKWLAGRMRIFIFDEPTRGVDIGAKVEIYNLMNRLTAQGAGIIMISSELPELLGMSDRVLVMHRGRIQTVLERHAATEERVLSAALGLGATTDPAAADGVVG